MNQAPINILTNASIAILVVDDTGTVVQCSAGALALWRLPAEDVLGRQLSALIPACVDDDTSCLQLRPYPFLPIVDAHGVQHNLRVLCDRQCEDGKTLHTLILYQDNVTDMQNRALDAIVQAKPLDATLAQLCADLEKITADTLAMLVLTDENEHLRFIASTNMPRDLLHAYTTLASSNTSDICMMAIRSGKNQFVGNISSDPHFVHCRHAAQKAGMRSCNAFPIKNDDGTVLAVLLVLSRQTYQYCPQAHPLLRSCLQVCRIAVEFANSREHIHHLTFYDHTTGLPNRSMLHSRVTHLLHHHRRTSLPLSLLLIKLHDISRTAATHADDSTDRLRQTLIQRIEKDTRQSDITGIMAIDEIAVILPRCSSQQAVAAAERFLNELRKPVLLKHSRSYQSNISIGVATCPDDSDDFNTLVRHASIAIQHAFNSHRRSICIYEPGMNQAVQERVRLENDLRDALRVGGLHMHYQPQVGSDASIGLLGVEALVRWQHPELGNIPPDKFIPVAEASNLIDDLTFWAIEYACAQLAAWRRDNVPIPRIAVNLSAVNLQNPQLPGKVAAVLSCHGLQPCDLMLEVTESAILHPDQSISDNVAALHKLGVLLSLDDFGTGYSSLSHLHRLPIQELKLDRSFIADLEQSPTAQILTHAILRLADNLGLHVVAEGVETEFQRDFLRRENCATLQGYLISRPLPPEELARWLAHQTQTC